jgi:hypothetical protein
MRGVPALRSSSSTDRSGGELTPLFRSAGRAHLLHAPLGCCGRDGTLRHQQLARFSGLKLSLWCPNCVSAHMIAGKDASNSWLDPRLARAVAGPHHSNCRSGPLKSGPQPLCAALPYITAARCELVERTIRAEARSRCDSHLGCTVWLHGGSFGGSALIVC